MKLIKVAKEIEVAIERIRYQAEKIKDCCMFGRKGKYRVRPRMCLRCKQRMVSILNRLR